MDSNLFDYFGVSPKLTPHLHINNTLSPIHFDVVSDRRLFSSPLLSSQSQYNLYGLIQQETRRGRRKSWSGQPTRLHHITSKSNPSLNTSSSFRWGDKETKLLKQLLSNFLYFRSFKEKEDVDRSTGDAARSVWPITQTETIFLPHFKIYERPLEKEFDVLNLIDAGAFGKVYFVRDKITTENYALKVLSKANVSQWTY